MLSDKTQSNIKLIEVIVVNSLPQRLIANFLAIFNKPLQPTKKFTSEDKAMKWLKTEIKKLGYTVNPKRCCSPSTS